VLPSELGELIGTLVTLSLFVLFISSRLYRRARRHALLPANELRKKEHRPLILFLRSFVDDKLKIRARPANGRSWVERFVKITFEEVLVDHLWHYGPVVAIGKPGESLPPLGASREYLPDQTWQQQVEPLIGESAFIVVELGRTEGLAWEISKIMELDLFSRLIIVLPPIPETDLRLRWDYLIKLLSESNGKKALINLPPNVDLNHLRAVVFPMPDIVYGISAPKGNDWSYEAVLDACVEILRVGNSSVNHIEWQSDHSPQRFQQPQEDQQASVITAVQPTLPPPRFPWLWVALPVVVLSLGLVIYLTSGRIGTSGGSRGQGVPGVNDPATQYAIQQELNKLLEIKEFDDQVAIYAEEMRKLISQNKRAKALAVFDRMLARGDQLLQKYPNESGLRENLAQLKGIRAKINTKLRPKK
jgi:hypothetical protein